MGTMEVMAVIMEAMEETADMVDRGRKLLLECYMSIIDAKHRSNVDTLLLPVPLPRVKGRGTNINRTVLLKETLICLLRRCRPSDASKDLETAKCSSHTNTLSVRERRKRFVYVRFIFIDR